LSQLRSEWKDAKIAVTVTKRPNRFLDVIRVGKTKLMKKVGIEEAKQEFMKLGQIEMSTVDGLVKQEKK
jgi:hypothetical protein